MNGLGSLLTSLIVATSMFLLLCQVVIVGVLHSLAAFLAVSGCGVLLLILTLTVHELGHLAVGYAVGLPFQRFTVGLLALVRTADSSIRVRLNKSWMQPAAYVQHDAVGSRWRWAAMVAAGPLVNLALGTACAISAAAVNPGPPADMPREAKKGWRTVALLYPGDPPTAVLGIAAVLNVACGTLNLIPGREAGFRTDGGQLLDLFRPGHP